MIRFFKLYLVAFTAFLAIDMIWLVFVARPFYRKHLGFLLAPNPNWIAAVLFYLLFILGLLLFVVVPGLKGNSLPTTLLYAALFGLVTYATYDLTNLATLKDWPLTVTVVDLIWGTVLSAAVSLIGYTAGRHLGW
jgi:uncharacterized membrane protein